MKRLIVNADDFGYSEGINEGIIEAHSKGIVTSASLMVYGKASEKGVKLAKKHSKLGLGLHFQIEDEDSAFLRVAKSLTAISQTKKVKKELEAQVQLFKKLTGRMPDHIDGHHHAHMLLRISNIVRELSNKENIPLRGDIKFILSFYGKRSLNNISIDGLCKALENIPDGYSEMMCHPAHITADLKSSYNEQRKIELETLISKEVREKIKELGIKLVNWQDYSALKK